MRIKLATPLIGEFPRYANVKLPDNGAVIAQNMRWDSSDTGGVGSVVVIYKMTRVTTRVTTTTPTVS